MISGMIWALADADGVAAPVTEGAVAPASKLLEARMVAATVRGATVAALDPTFEAEVVGTAGPAAGGGLAGSDEACTDARVVANALPESALEAPADDALPVALAGVTLSWARIAAADMRFGAACLEGRRMLRAGWVDPLQAIPAPVGKWRPKPLYY